MRLSRSSMRLFPRSVGRWSFLRKLRNPFAGLAFFTRCSDGSLSIASRHWPHQLCWSWQITWRWKGRAAWKMDTYKHNSGGMWKFGPLLGSWQNYDDMVALDRFERSAISFIERDLRRISDAP